jgi:hypothetical protein
MSEEKVNIPSQQEMEARQKEVNTFYETQIPFLKIQKEYETLVTELEELELRRLIARVKAAQIMAPPPQEEEKDAPPKVRSLKKD